MNEELLEIIKELNEEQQADLLVFARAILNPVYLSDNQPINGNGASDEREGEPIPSPLYDANQLAYTPEDIQAIIQKFPKNKKWTFDDLQNETIFPPEINFKIEIHQHKIFVMAIPSVSHQEILTNITIFMGSFVKQNKLGKLFVAPVHIKFAEGEVFAPDVLYLSFQKIQEFADNITEKSINVAPDLVIEVISPANYRKLRNEKKAIYAQNGVQEYWEIRPKRKSISVETLQNGEYQLFSEAKKKGKVQSSVLQGFEMEIGSIFI